MTGHLYLVGYRGTGKRTVGRLIAGALGWPSIDLDERIEARAGTSIAEIFAAEGEEGFRNRESAALEAAVTMGAMGVESVIATGGGIVLREANRRLLKATGTVVWLQASAETIWARIRGDAGTGGRRPDLPTGGFAEIVELVAARERFYREVADAAD